MGILRIIASICKASKTSRARLSSTFDTHTVLQRAFSSSPSIITDRSFSSDSIPTCKSLNEFLPYKNYPHMIYRSIHGGLTMQSQLVDANDKPQDESTNSITDEIIIRDTENICRTLSKNSDTPVDRLLDNASIEMSPDLVVEVLKRLSNAGVLALSFFKWAEKQKGFRYNTDIYNALIESLGKIRQFKLIWNYVNDMKSKGFLTKHTFALISRRYARARKVKEAIDAFQKMELFGFAMDSSDYNRLLDVLSKSRQVKTAQEVFDKMKGRKFMPDVKTYTILLEGWSQEQNLLRINQVCAEMREHGFRPDVVTYGIVINAHCKLRMLDAAINLFHEMEQVNCKPTPHIFCTLITWLGSEKRLPEALEVFRRSQSSGFPPEGPTYNAVVGAYCWSMQMDNAFTVLDEMRELGIGPNARTYDIILHHLIKAKRTKEAYDVFLNMVSEPRCGPTLSTYEIMVRMFCNEGRVDMGVRVWDEMKSNGVVPGMHMFSTLITSLCHENKLDDACKYFREMLDVGIRPPAHLFSSLKQALIDDGKNDVVVSLAGKLDKLRKVPLF